MHLTLNGTCDDITKVYFDGVLDTSAPQAELDAWNIVSSFVVPDGTQVVGIECENTNGPGGLLASFSNGLTTGSDWTCSAESFESGMAPATTYAKNGEFPQWPYYPTVSSEAEWIWTANTGDLKVYCQTTL